MERVWRMGRGCGEWEEDVEGGQWVWRVGRGLGCMGQSNSKYLRQPQV